MTHDFAATTTSTTAAPAGAASGDGAPVMPLELLQPLDGSNPLSTPASTGSPQQRLIVTPDPGVAGNDNAWLPPSQLLIAKDGQTRSIWPVHLAGWQALGWELLSPADAPDGDPPTDGAVVLPEPLIAIDPDVAPQAKPAPAPDSAVELEPDQEPEPAPSPGGAPAGNSDTAGAEGGTATTDESTGADSGEALLASEATDFQGMTKAQIVDFCSAVYGVELDGSQTKAELIEQATALENPAASGTSAAELAALELGDGLL
jgi:hypothetical protein